MARPIEPRAYTLDDRQAFDRRYGWKPANRAARDPQPAQIADRNWLDIAIGFAIGMSAIASLQAVAPMLRIIAQ